MKLYELTKEYNEVLAMVESGDFTEDQVADTLDGIQGEIDDKLQSTVCVIKEMEAEANKFDDEIKRMTNIKKTYTNNAKRLKEYIRTEMQKCDLDKSKGLFSISLSKPSQSVQIADVNELPDSFKVVTITANKAEIAKRLKAGDEVIGAELIDGERRLTIR